MKRKPKTKQHQKPKPKYHSALGSRAVGGGAGVVSRTHVVEPPTKRDFSAAAGPVVSAVGAAVEADPAVVAEAAASGAGGRANLPLWTAGRRALKPPMPPLPRRIVL